MEFGFNGYLAVSSDRHYESRVSSFVLDERRLQVVEGRCFCLRGCHLTCCCCMTHCSFTYLLIIDSRCVRVGL